MPFKLRLRGNAILDETGRCIGSCDSMPLSLDEAFGPLRDRRNPTVALPRRRSKPRAAVDASPKVRPLTADQAEGIRSLVMQEMQNAIPGYFRLP